jgi:hypothetical protein
MWINEVTPERLAELFHHYHQALTPEISGKGSERGEWKEVPQKEKSRLVAAVRLALLELDSISSERVKPNGAAERDRRLIIRGDYEMRPNDRAAAISHGRKTEATGSLSGKSE